MSNYHAAMSAQPKISARTLPRGPLHWQQLVEWLSEDAVITPEEARREAGAGGELGDLALEDLGAFGSGSAAALNKWAIWPERERCYRVRRSARIWTTADRCRGSV